ncbi:hypothetical protein N9S55_00930 [Candidatus Pelagibacter bacterium]|nr:hypothetical protein [Candidatus Pelagibacter bacterium]MDA9624930.1 hypothetical protein [Candidatus Pelagibacter bacterium]
MKKLLAIIVLSLFWTVNTYAVEKKKPLTVVQEIKQLGVFAEPSKYPEGMIEFFSNGCKSFSCRADKATKKMALTFKRSKLYHQRKPGHQLYALAMFELFYLNELKKKEKRIEKFLLAWPEKNKYGKEVISLIKLNRSKEKMRKSLGMDLNTSIEEAMERYWIMGDFLQRGEIKKEKISKDIKKREKLLAKYKKAVNKFNTELKNKEDEDLYKKIKNK